MRLTGTPLGGPRAIAGVYTCYIRLVRSPFALVGCPPSRQGSFPCLSAPSLAVSPLIYISLHYNLLIYQAIIILLRILCIMLSRR